MINTMSDEIYREKNVHIEIPENAGMILSTLHQAGFEAYVVGGCVRDSILNRVPGDWDITTDAKPPEIKSLFRRTVDTGIEHGTVTVMLGKEGFEVTTYRIDGEYADGRHPKDVTFTANLREDLRRRDFTINAMAYNTAEGLIDIFGGMEDIENKMIRCVGDPQERFGEDALRIMRAVRFSAQLDYQVEAQTKKAIMSLAPALSKISAERIQTELVKLLCAAHPGRIRDAWEMGILQVILPELNRCMSVEQNHPHHIYTVGEHMIVATENVRADRVLRLTMLLHDIAKPITMTEDAQGVRHFHGHAAKSAEMAREILNRLKFDRETLTRVCNLIYYHDRYLGMDTTPADIRKAIYEVGENDFPLLLEVKQADMMAQSTYRRSEKEKVLEYIQRTYSDILLHEDCLSLKNLAVHGQELITAGVNPGKEMGDILHAMLADVLNYPEHNTYAYLMESKQLKRFREEI